jgi:hypothetical protein
MARGPYSLFDLLVLGYFISHIPITLLVDCQALLPSSWYPAAVRDTLDWYVAWSGDPLMNRDVSAGGHPPWFRAIISAELCLQVPFFFAAISAWRSGGEWIRFPLVIYGAHTATTLLPILGTFASHAALTGTQRAVLLAIYAPYLLMPLALMLHGATAKALFPPAAAASASAAVGRPKRA